MIKFILCFICFLLAGITTYSKVEVTQNKKFPLTIQFNGKNNTPLIFHMTGDGGAVRFDLKMFKEYHDNGFSFLGLNSLKYFSDKKTPDRVANEMIPVIKRYSQLWSKETLMLVGFSFGAEIIPFLYDRLPDDMKKELKLVVLLTPSKRSDFHIRMRDMIGIDKKNERYDVVNETAKIKFTKVLAIYGKEEKPSLKTSPDQPKLKILTIKGGHGFKDSREVFRLIANELD